MHKVLLLMPELPAAVLEECLQLAEGVLWNSDDVFVLFIDSPLRPALAHFDEIHTASQLSRSHLNLHSDPHRASATLSRPVTTAQPCPMATLTWCWQAWAMGMSSF